MAGGKDVIPIVGGRPQATDGGMEGHHAGGCGVAGAVRVEATEDVVAAGKQAVEPGRIGANARGGDADSLRMDLEATHRIDRRLAEDDFPGTRGTDPEVSQVLAGAGGHPAPGPRPGTTQFRAHRPLGLSGHQQKDRICPAVCIQLARLHEWFDERYGKTTALREILANAAELAIVGDGQA